MKQLFFALIIVTISIPAFARSLQPTSVVASVRVESSQYNFSQVNLTSDGRLQVETSFEVLTKRLDGISKNFLMNNVHFLTDAETVTIQQSIICMFVMAPVRPYLSVASFNPNSAYRYGPLELKLSAQDCGMNELTFPAVEEQKAMAISLRDQLLLLAMQVVAEN